LLAEILERAPAAHGVLFDQPTVIVAREKLVLLPEHLRRCELVGGDFFQEVPAGGDLYVLSNIIHDWDNDRASQILRNCRKAMGSNARLLLIEMVLSGSSEPELARMTDLNMLMLTGGKERTIDEFRALLSASGFRLDSVRPLQPLTCLCEAWPE
jgi:hypothetical protein